MASSSDTTADETTKKGENLTLARVEDMTQVEFLVKPKGTKLTNYVHIFFILHACMNALILSIPSNCEETKR